MWMGKTSDGTVRSLTGTWVRQMYKDRFITRVRSAHGEYLRALPAEMKGVSNHQIFEAMGEDDLDGDMDMLDPTQLTPAYAALQMHLSTPGTKRSLDEDEDDIFKDAERIIDGLPSAKRGRGEDICGTFGCTLLNRHAGLHKVPDTGLGPRSRRR